MARKQPAPPAVTWNMRRFKGKTFAFAGRRYSWFTTRAEKLVKGDGGKVVPDVTAPLDFLVVLHGPEATRGKREAVKLNKQGAAIQIQTPAQFFQLFLPDRDLTLALMRAGTQGAKRWGLICQNQNVAFDLSGTDLHQIQFPGTNLGGLNLDRADLSQANLHGASLGKLTGARLDGARLAGVKNPHFVECSLRGADLSRAWLGTRKSLERSDFTGANLSHARSNKLNARGAIFKDTDLGNADLTDIDLGGADLRNANLRGADLTRATFQGADLTGADLGGALLIDADLRNATIDGANFAGALVVGARLDGLEPNKARGLDPAGTAAPGVTGPNLRALGKVAKAARGLTTSIQVKLSDGNTMNLYARTHNKASYIYAWARPEKGGNYRSQAKTLPAALLDLPRRWGKGELQLDSLVVKATKAPVTGKALKALVLAAWCEACGVPVITPDQLKAHDKDAKAQKLKKRDKLLVELRSGPKGIKRWNKRKLNERREAGAFRRADLSGADLDGAALGRMDFQGANFIGASLRKAELRFGSFKEANFKNADLVEANALRSKFQKADFEGANLTRADLRHSSFQLANFKNANLTEAKLNSADLCGADLSTTTLTDVEFGHTRFDDATKFPPGFALPEELRWAGAGPDPRLSAPPPLPAPALAAPTAPVAGLDLEGFLKQLAKQTRPGRLGNALQMLKADRFRLFSQVDDNSLVGVVKSQRDPDLVYSCRLASDGSFSCCTQNLHPCGGLQGALCKHLLVLVVGLTKGGQLNSATVEQWVQTSRKKRPAHDKDAASAVFLRYKGAEAGEVDWRPTETIPEDYYAF